MKQVSSVNPAGKRVAQVVDLYIVLGNMELYFENAKGQDASVSID